MLNFLKAILLLIFVTSCASLGGDLSAVNIQKARSPELKGLNPVEVKAMLGEPVFEGFHEGHSGQEVHTGIGFSYTLVYSVKAQKRFSYNLDDKKKCVLIVFKKSKQFKYDGRSRAWFGDFCSPGGLMKYNLKEFNTQKFWEKYGY